MSRRILKERHLKLTIGESSKNTMEAVWFHAAEKEDVMDSTAPGSAVVGFFAGVPELNRFQGRVTPTLRVKDFKKVSDTLW